MIISNCKHWSDCGIHGGGCCALELHGGRPSLGVCRACDSYDGPARGMGDRLENILKATGIHQAVKAVASLRGKPCKCSERRNQLNEILPSETQQR